MRSQRISTLPDLHRSSLDFEDVVAGLREDDDLFQRRRRSHRRYEPWDGERCCSRDVRACGWAGNSSESLLEGWNDESFRWNCPSFDCD